MKAETLPLGTSHRDAVPEEVEVMGTDVRMDLKLQVAQMQLQAANAAACGDNQQAVTVFVQAFTRLLEAVNVLANNVP